MSSIMGYCRRSSRMLFYGFRCCNISKIQESISRTRLHSFSFRRNFGEFGLKKQQQQQRKSPFGDGANDLVPCRGWRRLVWNLESAVALLFLGTGIVSVVYFGKWETVPYTKRKHLVMWTKLLSEEEYGKRAFEYGKKIIKEEVLPPFHPDSVRVRKITHALIEAFRRESADDVRSKKRVDGWEVACVDSPSKIILSFGGGNFIFSTGLLRDLGEDDAQIATRIARLLAIYVARQYTEKEAMLELIPTTLVLILHFFFNPATISSLPSLLKYLRLPCARSVVYAITWKALTRLVNEFYSLKMEVEGDHIGLLLMASAGYDPRVALQGPKRRGRHGPRWEKMRTQLLALHMDEALSIYSEVQESTVN